MYGTTPVVSVTFMLLPGALHPLCLLTMLLKPRLMYRCTAYVNPGFSSFRLKTHSWNDFTQIGTVYSPQRCSGDIVWQGCVGDSVNQVPIGGCYDLSDTGNALSSFSSGGPCPK